MSSTPAPRLTPSMFDESAAPRESPVAPRSKTAPGPRGPISAWGLMRDPLVFLEKIFRRYGDVVHLRLLQSSRLCNRASRGHQARAAGQPSQLHQVVRLPNPRAPARQWPGDERGRAVAAPAPADAADVSSAEDRGLRRDDDRMLAEMLERWEPRATSGEAFDVTAEMMRLTLHIVGRALLTMDLTGHADRIGHNMTIANELSLSSTSRP